MKFGITRHFALAMLMFWMAGSAQAVFIEMTITGTSGSGTISPDGLSITGVAVNDTVTVAIEIDNLGGDLVQTLFTTVTADINILILTDSQSLPSILGDPLDPFAPSIALVIAPEQKLLEPPGTYISVAYGGLDAASGAVRELSTTMTFTAIAPGQIDITGLLQGNDEAIINGFTNVPGSSPDLSFNPPIAVTVPEPSLFFLSLASLGTVLAIGRTCKKSLSDY